MLLLPFHDTLVTSRESQWDEYILELLTSHFEITTCESFSQINPTNTKHVTPTNQSPVSLTMATGHPSNIVQCVII